LKEGHVKRRLFTAVPWVVAACLSGVVPRADTLNPVDLADHGHWKRLKALIEPRVVANPNDAQAQWLLARVRAAYKDADGALPPAEKAAALDPTNPDYRWQVASVLGDQASKASMFKAMGLARRFRQEAEAALALNPRHIQSLAGLSQFYYKAPGIAGGDKKKAEDLANQVFVISRVDGCIAKISLLAQQSPAPVDQIEQWWLQAIQADQARYEPHASLANLYAGGKTPRFELSEKEALTARKIDPDRVGAYSILASVYAAQERWADLDAVLTEAEKQIPDNLSPFLRVAGTLQNTGKDLLRAERYARKYLSQEPEPTASSHAVAHWRLGLVLEKEGRKADAVAEVETATKMDPNFAQAQKDLKRLRS
jgi:tetratricopeptide (TPR) repeat protein